jgi:hypothetical protein
MSPVVLTSGDEQELGQEMQEREIEIGLTLGRMALDGIENCKREFTFAVWQGYELQARYEHYTEAMRKGLEAAVAAEEYELAAELRDMLATI